MQIRQVDYKTSTEKKPFFKKRFRDALGQLLTQECKAMKNLLSFDLGASFCYRKKAIE